VSAAPPPRYPFVPYAAPLLTDAEREERGRAFLSLMAGRRSVRDFAPTPVPRALVETAVRVAARAPSGANRQPWTFVIVDDPELKRRIREAAEAEERQSYEGGRMPPEWLEALAPLGTDWRKPFLETAPYLVVVFRADYGVGDDGGRIKNYYVAESVGIACGFFIAALHSMGLATLTHTPSPMGFLRTLLKRPENEKPFILFPVGYPAADATVPDITKKPFEAVVQWNDGTVGPREGAPAASEAPDVGADAAAPAAARGATTSIDWCVRAAACAAAGSVDDVRDVCARALADGVSAAALREALVFVVPYAGWPAGLNGLLAFAEVAAAVGADAAAEVAGRDARDRAALRQLGLDTARRVNGHFDRVADRVAALDPALLDLLLESAYGAVYNRPGLPLVERELVAVGILTVLRQERQLVYHAHGALNVGASAGDVRRAVGLAAGVDGAAAQRALAALEGRLGAAPPAESP
jgi:iodotyrosine deiodinase